MADVKPDPDVKVEPEAAEPTKSEIAIIEQTEYYFGDANIRRDKFMKQTLDENDGWMPMEIMLKFNRLKQLSEDKQVIAEALRKSTSGLLEVSEDGSKMRRSASRPVPEWNDNVKKDTNNRTVYVKGFPKTSTLVEVESFFTSNGFGKKAVWNIVLRRQLDNKEFKGSVFVEFCDTETVEKFVGGTYRLPEAEEDLLVLTRNDYYKRKEGERKELKDKLRESAVAAAIATAADNTESEELKYENGCVLTFDKCGEETTRESLKEIFGKDEEIQWVNFTKGDADGKIRFASPGGAERALEILLKENESGKITIDGAEATCTVLAGDAEEEYYREVRREVASAKARSRQSRFNHYRHTGRGKFRGGKRHGGGGYDGAPRAKRSRD
ncbi:lupus La protein homolog [Sycon ciliatum]|uniref:lupus La protein homolog n=1 Tax=Sycon ciliatum TaxID=27933 RepID=UPI0020AACBD3|eukprot:scpid59204/ scgid13627/ Lupus La protein homolog; La autoantigen homolog; La ribonucleoprotein